ncbi:hypothetical protein [Parapedobacter sp. 2B3]|uniref:hypothetical protein n=1 Tax=Parapedobacter sp. 2B3 TaxID=3342381 RepID=UPI0035B6866E
MDTQADIKWIQRELSKVRDPDLIEVFKRLLQFRKKNMAATIQEYNDDIEASEKDIKAGRVYSQNEVDKLNEVWKKSL